MIRALTIFSCIAALALAGCGSSSSSSSTSRTMTQRTVTRSASTSVPTAKFLLHMGLAFGAFHHFIYSPVRSGAITHPLSHPMTVVQAGLAALFISHELNLAAQDAQSSRAMRPVTAPLTAAVGRLRALKSSITSGSFSLSDLQGVATDMNRVAALARSAGHTITQTVPSPSQLAAGVG